MNYITTKRNNSREIWKLEMPKRPAGKHKMRQKLRAQSCKYTLWQLTYHNKLTMSNQYLDQYRHIFNILCSQNIRRYLRQNASNASHCKTTCMNGIRGNVPFIAKNFPAGFLTIFSQHYRRIEANNQTVSSSNRNEKKKMQIRCRKTEQRQEKRSSMWLIFWPP